MPKRSKDDYESDDGFVADAPHTKKSKSKTQPGAGSSSTPALGARQIGDDGEPYWALNTSGMRRVSVSAFKGKTMVNVREYYEKDGNVLPGKKGISLPMDQFRALVAALPGLEDALLERGEDVSRPVYGAARAANDEESAGFVKREESMPDAEGDKRNFEATSSEGEN